MEIEHWMQSTILDLDNGYIYEYLKLLNGPIIWVAELQNLLHLLERKYLDEIKDIGYN